MQFKMKTAIDYYQRPEFRERAERHISRESEIERLGFCVGKDMRGLIAYSLILADHIRENPKQRRRLGRTMKNIAYLMSSRITPEEPVTNRDIAALIEAEVRRRRGGRESIERADTPANLDQNYEFPHLGGLGPYQAKPQK